MMTTTQYLLNETGTTDLFAAYAAISEELGNLQSLLQDSYRFSPVQTGRVVTYSRRDVMELSIRKDLQNSIATLMGQASLCEFALDANQEGAFSSLCYAGA